MVFGEALCYNSPLQATMSNKEKREKVVDKMHKLIRFGNYAIPKSICGLIVDIQVSRIRALQKSCSVDSDLHKDDE